MTDFRVHLAERLRGAQRIAVLAVGSALRGDDVAGLLVAQHVDRLLSREGCEHASRRPLAPEIRTFMGETAPENLTGEIKRFAPTHLIVVDAADCWTDVGHVGIIGSDAPSGNLSFSTHSLPLAVMTDYLSRFIQCQVVMIGIQAAARAFGQPPSAQVLASANELAAAIVDVVHGREK